MIISTNRFSVLLYSLGSSLREGHNNICNYYISIVLLLQACRKAKLYFSPATSKSQQFLAFLNFSCCLHGYGNPIMYYPVFYEVLGKQRIIYVHNYSCPKLWQSFRQFASGLVDVENSCVGCRIIDCWEKLTTKSLIPLQAIVIGSISMNIVWGICS